MAGAEKEAGAGADQSSGWLDLLGNEVDAQFGTSSEEDKTRTAIVDAVALLAAKAAEGAVSKDIVAYISGVIAEIDQQLTAQINEIMHHDEFQQLEASWRGLDHLVRRTPARDNIKIRVLPISKKELGHELDRVDGARWQQSAIFKHFYKEGFDQFNAEPYACIVGDYYFDHSAPDVALLQQLSKTAAAAHSPFIASVGPRLFGLASWNEVNDLESLKAKLATPDRAAWRALREMEDARYIGMAMPRFMARMPYGPENKVEEFSFEEDTGGNDPSKFCWANAAYAMAANVTRAFANYGWCVKIRDVEEGGRVDNLPLHTFKRDDGSLGTTCPTEVAIGKMRATELEELGVMPLCHFQNTSYAAFTSANSIQEPKKYDDDDATANALLSSKLQYMLAVSRFSHYLDAMAVHWRGKFTSRDELEKSLQRWMKGYVLDNPHLHNEVEKAKRPLAHAAVEVEDVAGKPGHYKATFRLKPHFQFEGMQASVRLVSKEFS